MASRRSRRRTDDLDDAFALPPADFSPVTCLPTRTVLARGARSWQPVRDTKCHLLFPKAFCGLPSRCTSNHSASITASRGIGRGAGANPNCTSQQLIAGQYGTKTKVKNVESLIRLTFLFFWAVRKSGNPERTRKYRLESLLQAPCTDAGGDDANCKQKGLSRRDQTCSQLLSGSVTSL